MTKLHAACLAVLCAACGASPGYPPAAVQDPVGEDPESDAPPAQDVQIPVDGDNYADTDPGALTDFRADLNPYGTWVEDPTYGTIWVPNADQVGDEFTPYLTAGHWVYDDDYIWVSDYPWGWAPFHYGRWVWAAGHGWGWIPGRVFAGAWVAWRLGAEGYPYVGWAPMPPIWIWRGGVAASLGFALGAPFVFFPRERLLDRDFARHAITGARAAEIGAHSAPYVHASAHLGGHPLGQPILHGPPPRSLGIEGPRAAAPAVRDSGVGRAQQYARPSTAQPLGGHAAMPHIVRPVGPMTPPITRPRVPAIPRGGFFHGGGGHHR